MKMWKRERKSGGRRERTVKETLNSASKQKCQDSPYPKRTLRPFCKERMLNKEGCSAHTNVVVDTCPLVSVMPIKSYVTESYTTLDVQNSQKLCNENKFTFTF